MQKKTPDGWRTPLWVKVQGTLVALLILLVIAMSGGFVHIGPAGHGGATEGDAIAPHMPSGGGN